MRRMNRKQNEKSRHLHAVSGIGTPKPLHRRTSSAKRKPNIRFLFLVLFSLWALYTFLFILLPNKTRLEKEQQQLGQYYSQLQQQEQQLTQQVQDLQNDSYIARLARKYYNMIKQGEILFHSGE